MSLALKKKSRLVIDIIKILMYNSGKIKSDESLSLENREKLEEVTTILLEKETIMGPEFEAIMRGENI